FVVETFLILLQPRLEISRGFFEFVAIQQPASQRFKKRACANVVSELLVRFLVRAFGNADEKFFIQRCEPALNSAEAQRTLARDGPVRKSEREIVKRLGFKLGE